MGETKSIQDDATLLEDTESKIHHILSHLTEEELETAARASYGYVRDPVDRMNHASRVVERYLESKKGNVDTAMEKVKATLLFRREIDIDSLISAFDRDGGGNNNAEPLEKQLSSKKIFVQGYDKGSRSTLIFIPRLVQGHDAEWTLKEAVYSMERAIACSRAKDHTINAVVDFSGFSAFRHAPPVSIGKQFMTTLRSHYAGQIHGIYLLDTPSAFSFLWRIFSPFVGTKTREKIHFLCGKEKQKTLETLYEIDQATSWMVSLGTKNRELDLNEYLYETDFLKAFDERTEYC
jgi:hypothetical protein